MVTFDIESPKITIYHQMPLQTFLKVFPSDALRRVTAQYYTAECRVFNGIDCMVGFHFITYEKLFNEPVLEKLEFFRPASYFTGSGLGSALRTSFNEFQQRLESLYGPPTVVRASTYDPAYAWHFEYMAIEHYIYDRFGLGEYLFIYI